MARWAILAVGVLPAGSSSSAIIGPEQKLTQKSFWWQKSPSIAAEGDNVVAVWWRYRDGSLANYAYSTDQGATWAEGIGFPRPNPSVDYIHGMPPAVCATHPGVFYAAVGYFHTPSVDQYAIWVYRGQISGGVLSWGNPAFALPLVASTAGQSPYAEASIACDGTGERVYLACIGVDRGLPISTTVIFTHSTNAGVTWAPAETLGTNKSRGPTVSVGADGALTVVWEEFGTGDIVSRTSIDCGGQPASSGAGVRSPTRDAGPPAPCPLTFGPAVVVAPAHDNLRTLPPGLYWNGEENPAAMPCASLLVPNYPKLAVDRTSGPNQNTRYAVWASGVHGTALPGSGRTVTAVEPNDYWGGATPIEIGDDVVGDAISADVAEDAAEIFSFHGEQGTTLAIDAMATGTTPPIATCYGFGLYCGSDTTQLYSLGVAASGPTGSLGPPSIVTLPRTGTYYLRAEGSGSILTIRYRGRVRRLAVDPGSVARDQRDVVLSASRDGGQTWTAPVRVNDDPPWWDNSLASVAVDGQGTVHVAWYGRTDDGGCGKLVDVYWASSTDGGRTFGPSQRVSRNSNRWLFASRGPGDVGIHLGLAATGSDVHVVWTQEGQPDLDIYHARITDTVTSVLLRRLAATRRDGCVEVAWEFAVGAGVQEVCVYRSAPGEAEARVACVAAEGGAAIGEVCDEAASAAGVSYRLRARFGDGRTEWFGPVTVEAAGGAAPLQVQPNPFGGRLRIEYDAQVYGAQVRVRVLDAAGRLVATLWDGPAGPGRQELSWDGTRRGARVPPGIYYLEVRGPLRSSRVRIAKVD